MDPTLIDTLASEVRLLQRPGRCINLRGRLSCEACREACPRALPLRDHSGAIISATALEECSSCGACMAACPTEALSLPTETLSAWVTAVTEDPDHDDPTMTVACSAAGSSDSDLEVHCLRAWDSAVALFALAKAGAGSALRVVTGACQDCSEGRTGDVREWITEVRETIAALGAESRIEHEIRGTADPPRPNGGSLDRRRFLGSLRAAGARAMSVYARSKDAGHRDDEWGAGQPGARRSLAVHALQRAVERTPRAAGFSYAGPGRLSTLMPVADAPSCALCGDCTVFCPTGALEAGSVDGRWILLLDPRACVGCGLCASLCRSGALSMRVSTLGEVLRASERILVSAPAVSCTRCGATARADGIAALCATCSAAQGRLKGFY